MACTTILVGKNASYDGSTMIARNDDSGAGKFTAKKWVVVDPSQQPRVYTSVLSHVEIPLPSNPLRYTAMPNAVEGEGIWAAAGVNSENIAMTATETITSNPRVLAADPLVTYQPEAGDTPAQVGGIGEEDLVVLVLPYIHSAREGVQRLGQLLEQYGTYEMNGIAFQDVHEIWWLETIGGHHWMARRVPDDQYVVMPNQLGIDHFDFADAYGDAKEYMCSADLQDFVQQHHLNLNTDGDFNPRLAFGSHDDSDHTYNTPRAWALLRYFNPRSFHWDGPDADFHPESDDLPWSLVPEHKITMEEVKWALSNHFQGTPYDPYRKYGDKSLSGSYRTIGINRTSFMACIQLRPYVPAELQAIEWICYGCNAFNAFVPFYAHVADTPVYLKNTTGQVSTDSFYWASRLIGALSDAAYSFTASHIERYQNKVAIEGHRLIEHYDTLFTDEKAASAETSLEEANAAIATMLRKETDDVLDKVLYEASAHMKNAFSRSDA